MQKEQFETRIKELLPNMTEQAMDKWEDYAQYLLEEEEETSDFFYDAVYVELCLIMRTMAIQLSEELFERLKAYLKKNNLKQKQFIIGLIEDALEQDEEDTAAQADSKGGSEAEEPDEPDMDAEEE